MNMLVLCHEFMYMIFVISEKSANQVLDLKQIPYLFGNQKAGGQLRYCARLVANKIMC